jgi:1-aminocyclopropane-1-carboxylate deaminase
MPPYYPIIERVTFQGIKLSILRLDKLHPQISGNKWFKLKFNIVKAQESKAPLLTFGGPHSNHIAATAAACQKLGVPSAAIIRGQHADTPTLNQAAACAMKLHFVSRDQYRELKLATKEALQERFGKSHIVPEGGANTYGLLGCMEILKGVGAFDIVFCACGTATTFAGLVASAGNAVIGGISVLKGTNQLPKDAEALLAEAGFPGLAVQGNDGLANPLKGHFITNRFAFKGYATYCEEVITFKRQFESETGIPLDYIYTAPAFYAACKIGKTVQAHEERTILVIHTGGLQGNPGFEARYRSQLGKLDAPILHGGDYRRI